MILRGVLFFVCISALNALQSDKREDPVYMLPKNVKPLRYNLTMVPDFSADTFSGSVLIEITALETSNYITLHVNNLNMPPKENIIVQDILTGKTLTIASAELSNSEYQYFTISLVEMLMEGRTYVLTIPNFNANFGKYSSGFSSGTFQDIDGSTGYYAYTQFQPCDARSAFPSFDEPGLRAKFNIRLVRPDQRFISASNARLISQSISAPFEDVYEETVDMPTYLVAFTISEMEFSETLDIYRIIARPEVIDENQHRYALDQTVKIIDFMETYTNVPFTLPKLDQLAVSGFPGGMENWGLIVYGENSLLLVTKNNKAGIMSIVAHEIAHQWFGNLVGITWWEYIWLSEGFATYFENLIPGLLEPSIDGRGSFVIGLQILLQTDMRTITRPLTENARTLTEISGLFDIIAYNKGGAVIHMLEHSLTTPVFQQGIKYYVEKMQFGQATSSDLYESLQKAVDESANILPEPLKIVDFMNDWELVAGFPVVDVRRNYGNNSDLVTLSQKRYPEGEIGKWIIPINFATSTNPSFEHTNPDHWMTDGEGTVSVSSLNENGWLIANKKETGYYRVNYDDTNWELITQTLTSNHLEIHVLNRAQLVDDSMNLAKTGHLDYDIAWNLVEYIQNEQDPIPWFSYSLNARRLATFFYYSLNYQTFKDYNYNITKTVYNYVGFEEKPHECHLQKDLRELILSLLCHLDHPDCLNKSLLKFKYWQKSGKYLPELEAHILCGAIRSGSQTDFNYLFNELKQMLVAPNNVIAGLSCSKNINNLNRLMQLDDKIALDEIIEMVMNSGPEGLHAAITFMADNFANIEQRLKRKTGLLIKKISQLVSTAYHLNALMEAISTSADAQFYTRMFEDSENKIAWRKLNLNKLAKKLTLAYSIKEIRFRCLKN